ncbi:MAG: EAL domain-containing protein [Chloroflexota bacterium]|nr:MAG: EAL domain-containing protein [Chloroflexota bacterium]
MPRMVRTGHTRRHDPGLATDAACQPIALRRGAARDQMRVPRAVRRPIRPAVRLFGLVVLPTSLFWAGFGVVINDPALVALGLVGAGFATWLLYEHHTSAQRTDAQVAVRVAVATNIAALLAATAEPITGLGLAIGALVPAIMGLTYLDRSAMRRLMSVGILTGTYAAVASLLLPWGSNFAFPLNVVLALTTFAIAFAVYHLFLWNASGQLTDTAAELGAVIELSREIALTLDPQQVGRIIAEHIARAAGAQESALSTWDRAHNRLVTFAYYPPERAELLDATYDLALYPATAQVLMDGKALRVETEDPGVDTAELAYLRDIGQKSMVILPLVARGESIGIVELTSDEPGGVTDRGAAFAEQLLREAAISLENARLYDEIHHQAFRDSLTGLANRMLFHDRVSHALDRLRGRSPNHVAVLFLDLDHFKLLNDRYGHSRADDVLRAVADRVRGAIRPGDTAARLGGDEFAILLADVSGPETALSVAERVLEGLAEEIEVGDGSTRVGASIGIALSSSVHDTVDDLLRNADIAMYAGKELGRGRVELFRPALLERAAARSQLGSLLHGSVERGEFSLAFQPIVDLGSRGRHIVGLEALVRWQPAGNPMLMPTDFVALAEETGDIVPIGNWVIREACIRTREIQLAHDRPDLRINVNLSSRQFEDPRVVQTVADALDASGLAPACLTIEITESTIMTRTDETLAVVRDLRALGVRLSIDDFGTGYSSLSYLQAFEVDELKIDRSFVSSTTGIGNPLVLSRAIVELGRALGLEMVVEGVETKSQAAWFASLGCHYAQGFLYGRPMDQDGVNEYFAGRVRTPARTTTGTTAGSRSPHPLLSVIRDDDAYEVAESG